MCHLVPRWRSDKESACQETQEMRVQSLGQEDPLEKGMATHSSVLAWRIPRTEQPGGLQSMGLQRIRHDLATKQQQQCTTLPPNMTQQKESERVGEPSESWSFEDTEGLATGYDHRTS